MNLLLKAVIVFTATGFCTGCSSKLTRKPLKNSIPKGDRPPSNISFTAGDVIACDLNFTYAASHILLATSRVTVTHVPGPKDDGPWDITRLVEEDFIDISSRYEYCKVITEFYDRTYASYCNGKPFNTSEILRRADASRIKFRGQVTHYDARKCNCEHWVSAWRYGSAWTLQLPKLFYGKYKSDECEAPGKQNCF